MVAAKYKTQSQKLHGNQSSTKKIEFMNAKIPAALFFLTKKIQINKIYIQIKRNNDIKKIYSHCVLNTISHNEYGNSTFVNIFRRDVSIHGIHQKRYQAAQK